jgi:pimeloyl-ACP methyl ester carboxylesterase
MLSACATGISPVAAPRTFGRSSMRRTVTSLLPTLLLSSLPLLLALSAAAPASAQSEAAHAYGIELQGFTYPHPLQHYQFSSQGTDLQMAYMDVPAKGKANGRTAVLLHGKNFCGATWDDSITALSNAGYRVIAPDQIGFCASTKPQAYQYTFQQLASNTHALLEKLGIEHSIVIGHSTGGMLGMRYALMFPEATDQLVLINPIGLEDWKALGVPYRSYDEWNKRELATSAEKIRSYEKSTYYVNRWKPEYEKWVDMLAGLNSGPGHVLVARNSAALYDMIFTQPVFYEMPKITVPTLLMIGTADTTAIGSDVAPPNVKARIGHYDVLGKEAASRIPGSRLIEFPGLGHAPMMENPDDFHKKLIEALAGATHA